MKVDYVIIAIDIMALISLGAFCVTFRKLEKNWKRSFDCLIKALVNLEKVVGSLETKVYWLEKAAEEKGWNLEEIVKRYSNYQGDL